VIGSGFDCARATSRTSERASPMVANVARLHGVIFEKTWCESGGFRPGRRGMEESRFLRGLWKIR
jgi:hypothetical protein